MNIVYQELVTQDDFNQCIDMQRNLFNLPDIDIVSPLILQLIARGNPSTGITLGAFSESDANRELIGFILSFATFQKTIYGAMIGVKPQYRSQGVGFSLFLKIKEIALNKNIFYFQGVYEPLEKNLAHLYFNKLGFSGVQYLKDSNYESIASDKILLKWDLKAFSTHNKNRNKSLDIQTKYPVATQNYFPNSPYVLVEIPENFSKMEKENIEEARHWRQSTRKIFSNYINDQKYIVHDFLSFEENGAKKYFYLLKDQ